MDLTVGTSIARQRVVRVLDELVAVHGTPASIRVDNGPEFLAQPFVEWCGAHRVVVHYIQPGKPDQNAYIERFNRSYRGEILNAHLVDTVGELQALSRPGCTSTTVSGPTTASAGYRPDVSAEAKNRRPVSIGTVYLTGKLTAAPPCRPLQQERFTERCRGGGAAVYVAGLSNFRHALGL